MNTQQIRIVATGTSGIVVPADPNRTYLSIRCYTNAPGTLTPQTDSFYVAFGQAATAGANGEMEFPPGTDYIFGGQVISPWPTARGPDVQCPQESINIIAPTGRTVYGAILVFTVSS